MIFCNLQFERQIYVGEMTLMSAVRSVATSNEGMITSVLIKPEGADFISITEDRELSWVFEDIGPVSIELKITTEENATGTVKTFDGEVVAIPDLLSNDNDLVVREPGIMNELPRGHSSYIRAHVAAQNEILDYLYKRGIRSKAGSRLVYGDLADIQEVRTWAVLTALAIIFEGLDMQPGDTFSDNAKHYRDMADSVAASAIVSIVGESEDQPTAHTLSEIRVGRA